MATMPMRYYQERADRCVKYARVTGFISGAKDSFVFRYENASDEDRHQLVTDFVGAVTAALKELDTPEESQT